MRGDCLADIDAVRAPKPPTWTRAEDTDMNQAPGTNSEGEAVSYTLHDDLPREEARLVDDGLDSANDQAAPLREVQPLSCFARLPSNEVVGGALGRTWGPCCELQQIWVATGHRRRGIGRRLVGEFEARALARGCHVFYLETFSFQAPQLYLSLGYQVQYEHAVYPHGIIKYMMIRRVDPAAPHLQR